MHHERPCAFAWKSSGLDDFLYAEIGVEANGSPLTILSLLARLGLDPWTQAADWATLPAARAIDGLTRSIEQMPLTPAVLAESRAIAGRLVQLLPTNRPPAAASGPIAPNPASAIPDGSLRTMIWCGVAAWLVLSVLMAPKIATDTPAAILPTAPSALR